MWKSILKCREAFTSSISALLKRFSTNNPILQQSRSIRTSSRNNAVPPLIVLLIGRVARVSAAVFGRVVRKWWQKLPNEERAKYGNRMKKYRFFASGILAAMVLGGFVYYETHTQVTPYTKRKRFLAFSSEQMKSLSEMSLEAHLEEYHNQIIPAKSETPVFRGIVNVAERLLKGNEELCQKNWTITVVAADDIVNAFVLPCGNIFVFTGLLKVCDSEDQLGVILAHEMAHAVLEHTAEKVSLLHLLDLFFVVVLAALWLFLPSDLAAAQVHLITSTLSKILMKLPHSRFLEEEADMVGLMLAAKACFDIREAPVVWAKIRLMEQDNTSLEWLSTHPSHERRQVQLEEMVPAGIEMLSNCKCPPLPKLDPRLKIKVYEETMRHFQSQNKKKAEWKNSIQMASK